MTEGRQPVVLVVDDDKTTLRAVARFLGEYDIDVIAAESPFEATRLGYLHRPDVVILDVMMPALDGQAVATFLRKTPEIESIPIIFYSAIDEDRLRSVAASVTGATYVPKTSGLKALHDKVLEIVGSTPKS